MPPCVRVLAHGGGRARLIVQSVRVRDGGIRGVRLSHGRGMHGGHSVLVLLPVHALPADTGRGGSRARAADVVLLGSALTGFLTRGTVCTGTMRTTCPDGRRPYLVWVARLEGTRVTAEKTIKKQFKKQSLAQRLFR